MKETSYRKTPIQLWREAWKKFDLDEWSRERTRLSQEDTRLTGMLVDLCLVDLPFGKKFISHGKVKQLPPDVQISSIEARLKELQEKLDKNLNEFPPSLHEIRLAERRRRYREKKIKNKIPSS